MSQTKGFSHEAGEQFGTAAGFGFEDATQRRLRYHLLRLTVAGLTRQDVEELGELARLAFDNSDVTERTTRIKQRPDISPLGFAIADIVERASSGVGGPASLRSVMLGAVLGAYASLRDGWELDRADAAVVGAVGGAVAMPVSGFVLDNIEQVSAREYFGMGE